MFLKKRFYIAVLIVILCFITGYKSIFMFSLAQLLLVVLLALCAYELFMLYATGKKRITARRECAERFSNGDNNPVSIHLSNNYPFPVDLEIVDEVPIQFQLRNLVFKMKMKRHENKVLRYPIRPVRRGVYRFGVINVLVSTKVGFISRRIRCGAPAEVKVYPSFIHLKEYEIMAASSKLTQYGSKKIRKIGQHLEPDQIKDYVKGDDYRFINWKATARRGKLMTNVFRDERAQNIYCIIDRGRTMQSPFEGMSLLDYAINASLALSYVAMLKGDKAGLVAFEKSMNTMIPASRHATQIQTIQEALYRPLPAFAESNFEVLYNTANQFIRHRSLLVIFTNFDSVQSMNRQLRYLSMLEKHHSILVVFFRNTGLEQLSGRIPRNKEEVYETVIAEKLEYDKALIIHKLRQQNIMSLFTSPESLSVNVINKYLDIKAREQ